MIGKYVDYKPQNNTYIAKANMTGITENWTIKETDQIFSTETDMNWRIWDVDNNSIMLISDKPTTKGGHYENGKLGLEGNIGFTYGSEALDELCKVCYNSEKYNGIKVRSLNLTDIKKVLNKKTWDDGIKKMMNTLNSSLKNVQIDGWWYDEIDDSDYINSIYFELIHGIKDEERYYLNSRLDASGVEIEEKRVRSVGGFQVVENDCLFYEEISSDDGYELDFRDSYECVRPIIIIPLKSCKLDMSNSGTKADKWEINVK